MVEFNLDEQKEYLKNLTSIEEVRERLVSLVKQGLDENKLSALIDDIAESLNWGKEAAGSFKNEIMNAANAIITTAQSLEILKGALEFTNNFTSKAVGAIDTLKKRMGDAGMSSEAFGVKIAAISPWAGKLQQIPEHFNIIGKAAQDNQAQIHELFQDDKFASKAMDALSKVFGKDILALDKKDLQEWFRAADAANNLKTGMMMAASASGNLGNFLDRAGSSFQNLGNMAATYNREMEVTARATGLTKNQVASYQLLLDKMPQALGKANEETNIAGRRARELEAAHALALGTGRSLQEVLDDVGFAASTLGLRGEDALQFVERMSSVAQSVGLPLEDVRKSIKETAEEFAMLGDNSDAAVNLMSRLAPALREVGVAPAQAQRIFKELTSSIAGMSTAQKAFLSQSTGGASGLQGAFQIEQMMAEGKMDQVFTKMQENLRSQFGGGPIVTRDQAAQSPEQAAQYQRQVMLMMSPAMGGMAKDSNSAAKLIDAMAKGDLTGFSKGMSGSSEEEKDASLAKSMRVGEQLKLQSVANTLLKSIDDSLAAMGGDYAIGAANFISAADDIAREVSGFRTKKQENEDAAMLVSTEGTSASATVRGRATVSSNDQIERVISPQLIDSIRKGDLGSAASGLFDNITNEVGFINKPNMDIFNAPLEEQFNQEQVDEARGFQRPEQRTANVIDRSERQRPQRAEAQANKETVNVHVTTVCAVCDQKVAEKAAKDAAGNAIKHYHGSNVNQAMTGAGRQ